MVRRTGTALISTHYDETDMSMGQYNDYNSRECKQGSAVDIVYMGHPGDSPRDARARRWVVEWRMHTPPHLIEKAMTGPDVVFGLRAAAFLERRLDAHLLGSWSSGTSSLREPALDDLDRRRWLVSQNG